VNFSGGLSPRWHATVTTPHGTYSVLDPLRRTIWLTDDWPSGKSTETVNSYHALVERLAREGWEPLGGGQHWWQGDFRRPALPRQREYCEIVLRQGRWVADAINDHGQYAAGQSGKLKGLTRRAKIAGGASSLQSLKEELESAGWSFVANVGPEVWSERWERQLDTQT
jgi:hypothetical protein